MSDSRVTMVGLVRYGVGSVMLFGVTPQYMALWLAWRGASIFMPSWIYQWGDDKLYSLYQRLVLFFFESCTGVEVVFYGDTADILKRSENVLYLANHQSTVDWLIVNMVSIRGGNIGHLRYVMKNTLQLIPLYGWYFYAHGCIYVRRGNFNQNKMRSALDYLKNDKIPTWLVVFPEGTRYHPSTASVIEKSEKYARDNDLPVLRHHLVPKHRGAWLTLQHLHNKFDAVYDVSVFYEGSVDKATGRRKDAPQLIQFLMGRCPRIHIKVRRIPIESVPKEENELKYWMHNLFVEKDRLMSPFYTGIIDQTCELSSNTLVPLSVNSNGCIKTGDLSLPDANCSSNDLPNIARYDYASMARHYRGTVSPLRLRETMPSFIVFCCITLSCFYFSWARKIYLGVMCYGTLGAYVWLAVCNVC